MAADSTGGGLAAPSNADRAAVAGQPFGSPSLEQMTPSLASCSLPAGAAGAGACQLPDGAVRLATQQQHEPGQAAGQAGGGQGAAAQPQQQQAECSSGLQPAQPVAAQEPQPAAHTGQQQSQLLAQQLEALPAPHEQPQPAQEPNQDDGTATLFFAKVPRSASRDEVLALFSSFGEVVSLNLFTPYEGAPASKGCGLVVMRSHAAAVAAISALDSYTWEGMHSAMVVKLMNPGVQKKRQEQQQQQAALRQHDAWGARLASPLRTALPSVDLPPAGCAPDAYKLFVGNIPRMYSEGDLLPVFESIGPVRELVVLRDRQTQDSKGSAFVWYATGADADKAVASFNLQLVLQSGSGSTSRPLVVRRAATQKPGAAALRAAGLRAGDPYGMMQLLPGGMDAMHGGGVAMLPHGYALAGHAQPGQAAVGGMLGLAPAFASVPVAAMPPVTAAQQQLYDVHSGMLLSAAQLPYGLQPQQAQLWQPAQLQQPMVAVSAGLGYQPAVFEQQPQPIACMQPQQLHAMHMGGAVPVSSPLVPAVSAPLVPVSAPSPALPCMPQQQSQPRPVAGTFMLAQQLGELAVSPTGSRLGFSSELSSASDYAAPPASQQPALAASAAAPAPGAQAGRSPYSPSATGSMASVNSLLGVSSSAGSSPSAGALLSGSAGAAGGGQQQAAAPPPQQQQLHSVSVVLTPAQLGVINPQLNEIASMSGARITAEQDVATGSLALILSAASQQHLTVAWQLVHAMLSRDAGCERLATTQA